MNDVEPEAIGFKPVAPERDLWPGIEARISSKRPWRAYVAGIAALLVLSVSLGLLFKPSVPLSALQQRALVMQSEHQQVLASLQPPGTSDMELPPALTTLDVAEQQIMSALEHQSRNPMLIRMLAGLHHKRIDLLRRSYYPNLEKLT